MSGQLVMAPARFPAIGLTDVLRERIEREKQSFVEWQAFRQQHDAMAERREAEQTIVALEKRLASIQLLTPTSPSLKVSKVESVSKALSLGQSRMSPEKVRDAIDEIRALLDTVPDRLRAANDSPFPVVFRHAARLFERVDRGDLPTVEELATFRETVARTLEGYLADLNARRKQQDEITGRVEAAVNELMFYSQLSLPNIPDIDVIRGQLAALLQSGEIKTGALELIERRLVEMRKLVDACAVGRTHRAALCEAITRNLSEMGYHVVSPFQSVEEAGDAADIEAVMRIPGGEQVRVILQANNQMAFQVMHERTREDAAIPALTNEELERLHRQEDRWCKDFRELLRRLVAEGFPYEIVLERHLPQDSIRIAVVETPEEILARQREEERFDETRKRYLP